MSVAQISDIHMKDTSHRAIEVHGAVDVSFKSVEGETSLDRVYYRDPLKVLFPRGELPTAVLVTTGGGLLGGDTYDINIHLAEKTKVIVTAQSAEKVYRSSGPDCEVNVNLNVEADACLEWLPQETILFNKARFRRKTKVNLSATATALVGEIIVFGRLASGEELEEGLLREMWEVRREGKLIWTDALHIANDFKQILDHKSGFGGARAIATAIYAGPDAEVLLNEMRDMHGIHPGVRIGASCVRGLLICRWLAPDPYELRQAFGDFWAKFRHKTMDRENQLPRLWHC